MSSLLKKAASYFLIILVLGLTIISLLAVWDVIDVQDVIKKILISLFVIFVASVIVLFISAVVINDKNKKEIT